MKIEESLMHDERIWYGYAKAALSGVNSWTEEELCHDSPMVLAGLQADDMLKEHRKRFPKKIAEETNV